MNQFIVQGMCHQIAIKDNIKHARLPLDKVLKMQARKVLTINHGK